MADADRLKPYTPPTAPPRQTEDLPRFVVEELRKVRDADALVLEVLRALEARLVAGGL
jgi:hypothetical protein